MSWLVKRRRYDGTETVVAQTAKKPEADEIARRHNGDYQSRRYYVEEYDPAKLAHQEPPC